MSSDSTEENKDKIYANLMISVKNLMGGNQEWTSKRHWQHWVRTQDTGRRQTKQINVREN